MGVVAVISKWLGKRLGGAFRVPVEDFNGVPHINVPKYKYADRIADLEHEKVGVSKDYLSDLIEQAHRKRDFEGLRAIRDYLQGDANDIDKAATTRLLERVSRYAQGIKMFKDMGDPFALLQKIGEWLC